MFFIFSLIYSLWGKISSADSPDASFCLRETGACFSLHCKKSVAMARTSLLRVELAAILPTTAHVMLQGGDSLRLMQPRSLCHLPKPPLPFPPSANTKFSLILRYYLESCGRLLFLSGMADGGRIVTADFNETGDSIGTELASSYPRSVLISNRNVVHLFKMEVYCDEEF